MHCAITAPLATPPRPSSRACSCAAHADPRLQRLGPGREEGHQFASEAAKADCKRHGRGGGISWEAPRAAVPTLSPAAVPSRLLADSLALSVALLPRRDCRCGRRVHGEGRWGAAVCSRLVLLLPSPGADRTCHALAHAGAPGQRGGGEEGAQGRGLVQLCSCSAGIALPGKQGRA